MRFNFSQVTYCKLFNEMLIVNSQLPAKILQFFHFITIHPKKLKNREKKLFHEKCGMRCFCLVLQFCSEEVENPWIFHLLFRKNHGPKNQQIISHKKTTFFDKRVFLWVISSFRVRNADKICKKNVWDFGELEVLRDARVEQGGWKQNVPQFVSEKKTFQGKELSDKGTST